MLVRRIPCKVNLPQLRPIVESMRKRLVTLFSVIVLCSATLWAADDFVRTEDVIYGRKLGVALTLDIFQPKKTNGLGIIFVVSGGWFSAHEAINPGFFRPLLEHGYTVFPV